MLALSPASLVLTRSSINAIGVVDEESDEEEPCDVELQGDAVQKVLRLL